MRTEIFEQQLLGLQRNLLNFAYTLTSNREDAYDLLQDTTLKALDSREMYIDNVNFKGWVFTIMRNLFINKYRRDVRSVVVIDRSDDLYQLNMSQESAYDNPEGTLNVKEIHAALGHLPREFGEPFTMYISGYHYAEIARTMNLPVGTVKSRIFQARRRLQASLRDLRFD